MPGSLVVVNPYASRVRDRQARQVLTQRIHAVLTARDGVAPRIVETATPEDTRPLVAAALDDGMGAVVGVGGDGTMRDIAAVLADTRVPLGIVPAGTGNQVAAVLGVPLKPEAAIAALAGARTRTIDLGEVRVSPTDGPVTTSVFIIGCGAGLDARLMATTPGELKRRIGKSAYFMQAARLAPGIRAAPCRIEVDGEVIETETSIVLVGNMGQLMPGVLDLRLPIDPSDGLFDMIAVGAHGPLHGLVGLADQLWRTELGGRSGATSIRRRGRVISITPERPEPMQIDGDYVGEGSLNARILPGALKVLVPDSVDR